MALPPHTSWAERAWHYTYRLTCALVFLFLVAPILVIIPLSFNAGAFFTYPLTGVSLRWYREFVGGEQWRRVRIRRLRDRLRLRVRVRTADCEPTAFRTAS